MMDESWKLEGASEAVAEDKRLIRDEESTEKIEKNTNNNIQLQPTDLTNKGQQVFQKKLKPIPPPLDLSINSSLHQQQIYRSYSDHTQINNRSTTDHQQQIRSTTDHHNHYSPYYPYSPKFSQSEKNLPLRKRWLSWSSTLMNGHTQDDSSLSLYQDSNKSPIENGGGNGSGGEHSQSSSPFVPSLYHPYSSGGGYNNNSRIQQQFHGISNGLSNSSNLNNTPTPFYTPNETSPKFMNSPVFSYSTPDASLYQGPFSPIRNTNLYPPPNSPFNHLNLNTSTGTGTGPSSIMTNLQNHVQQSHHTTSHHNHNHHHISSSTSLSNSSSASSSVTNPSSPCFNMIPSTLLSPAPSQTSTNSLSYEDLHDKSTNYPYFACAWNIFMPQVRVRFLPAIKQEYLSEYPNEWITTETLSQSAAAGDTFGFKGEYAPLGLEVRTLVVTSSAKEKIQMTFQPVADPNQPNIEINCEPSHPFYVEKKGWCAVKPELFKSMYGVNQCHLLECGDVCINILSSRSPTQNQNQLNNHHHIQQQHHQSIQQQSIQQLHQNQNNQNQHQQLSQFSQMFPNQIVSNGSIISPFNSASIIKLEHLQNHHDQMMMNEKHNIPISVVPQNQTVVLLSGGHNAATGGNNKKYCPVPFSAPGSPAPKKVTPTGESKGRRPMNAFLLFAKDKRPELIQMYPGKDNRSISVLLGEAWQSLLPKEKEKYAASAKARAEEQKRIHPDCWKRKRSQSTS